MISKRVGINLCTTKRKTNKTRKYTEVASNSSKVSNLMLCAAGAFPKDYKPLGLWRRPMLWSLATRPAGPVQCQLRDARQIVEANAQNQMPAHHSLKIKGRRRSVGASVASNRLLEPVST